MKKIIIVLSILAFFLLSNTVSADSCTEPGYKWCWEEYGSYGSVSGNVKVFWQFQDANGNDVWNTYPNAFGGLYIKGGAFASGSCTGGQFCDTTIYGPYVFYNAPSWDWIWNQVSCNGAGCTVSGYNSELPNGVPVKIASVGQSFTDCVTVVSVIWVSDYTTSWMWKAAGYGWIGGGNCLDIKVVADTLPIPTGVSASSVSLSEIKISWNAVSGALSYQIEKSTGKLWTSTTTSTTETDLLPSTTHSYSVRACGSSGCSSWSAYVSATTGAIPQGTLDFVFIGAAVSIIGAGLVIAKFGLGVI